MIPSFPRVYFETCPLSNFPFAGYDRFVSTTLRVMKK